MLNESYIYELYKNPPFDWGWEHPTNQTWFDFETLDPFWWHDFVIEKYYYSIYAGVLYILTIFGLEQWMKDRPAFSLRTPLFLWNAFLGIFSIIGFIRFLPTVYIMFNQENAFYKSICVRENLTIPMAFWGLMFALSKFVELGDTVFLVLRKKPLVFLQWYHHLITMTATWILTPYMEPVHRWFAFLNYGVHSLMYPYFAMRAIGIRIPSQIANLITTLQFGQMIVGLFVNVLSMYYYEIGYDCFRFPISIKVFSAVYSSFIILFGKLFYDAVIMGGRKQREKLKKIS